MSQPIFPSRRPNGSVAVAARYSVSSADLKKLIQDYVEQSNKNRSTESRTKMMTQLLKEPYALDHGQDFVDIVIEGNPTAKRWKDYLAEVVANVPRAQGIAFEGLWDLATNKPHPGTLRRDTSSDNWPTRPL